MAAATKLRRAAASTAAARMLFINAISRWHAAFAAHMRQLA